MRNGAIRPVFFDDGLGGGVVDAQEAGGPVHRNLIFDDESDQL